MSIGRQHYLVRSWTNPEHWYSVDSEEWHCSCRGFECLGYCRHLTTIKELERAQDRQESGQVPEVQHHDREPERA